MPINQKFVIRMKKIWIYLIPLLFFIVACQSSDDEMPALPMELNSDEILQEAIQFELNPSGNAPLAAKASFQTLEPVAISLVINGEEMFGPDEANRAENHEIDIFGLRAGMLNEVVFVLHLESGAFSKDTLMLETAVLPEYFPNIHVRSKNLNKMEPGFTLCEFLYGKNGIMVSRPFIFDHNGFIRWYLKLEQINNFTHPIKRLANGNWVFGLDRFIYEYDMLGYEINQWELDGFGQHHDIVEKEDGNLILAVTNKSLQTIEDHIVELDRNTGTIIKTWDLREVLDVDRFDLIWNSRDWLHVNSIWYDETDGGMVISGRHQGIFKISRENELEWILAPHKGWETAGINGEGVALEPYLLRAVDNDDLPYVEEVQVGEERAVDFDWPWGQHDASILPNGHLLTFDNGFNRNYRSSSDNRKSRGVEYELDLDNGWVKQVWEYGQDLDGAFYSRNLSSAAFLPNSSNRILCSGNIHYNDAKRARIVELTFPESIIVFEVDINFANIFGNGTDAWGQTDMMYRAYRLSLYP